MRNAATNAFRLHDDALANLKEGRYLSAALLACYSYDEFGKAFVLGKLTFAAVEAGNKQVERSELRAAGVLEHKKRMEFASELLAPIFSGMPPGVSVNDVVAKRIRETIWKLRNSVAYVDAENGVFIDPASIDPAVCREAVETISHVRKFVEIHVLPYLEKKLQQLDP